MNESLAYSAISEIIGCLIAGNFSFIFYLS